MKTDIQKIIELGVLALQPENVKSYTAGASATIYEEIKLMEKGGEFLNLEEKRRWMIRLAFVRVVNDMQGSLWVGRCSKCGDKTGPWGNVGQTVCLACVPETPAPTAESTWDALMTTFPQCRIAIITIEAWNDEIRRQVTKYAEDVYAQVVGLTRPAVLENFADKLGEPDNAGASHDRQEEEADFEEAESGQ